MLTIHVCVGSACHIKGSYSIINSLQKMISDKKLEDRITVKAALCLGECTQAVSVRIDDGEVLSVNQKNLEEFFNKYIMEEYREP